MWNRRSCVCDTGGGFWLRGKNIGSVRVMRAPPFGETSRDLNPVQFALKAKALPIELDCKHEWLENRTKKSLAKKFALRESGLVPLPGRFPPWWRKQDSNLCVTTLG